MTRDPNEPHRLMHDASPATRREAHRAKMAEKKAARLAANARANAHFDGPQRRLDALDEFVAQNARLYADARFRYFDEESRWDDRALTSTIPTISDEAAAMMRQTVDYMNAERTAEEVMIDLNRTMAMLYGR